MRLIVESDAKLVSVDPIIPILKVTVGAVDDILIVLQAGRLIFDGNELAIGTPISIRLFFLPPFGSSRLSLSRVIRKCEKP